MSALRKSCADNLQRRLLIDRRDRRSRCPGKSCRLRNPAGRRTDGDPAAFHSDLLGRLRTDSGSAAASMRISDPCPAYHTTTRRWRSRPRTTAPSRATSCAVLVVAYRRHVYSSRPCSPSPRARGGGVPSPKMQTRCRRGHVLCVGDPRQESCHLSTPSNDSSSWLLAVDGARLGRRPSPSCLACLIPCSWTDWAVPYRS